jgi:TraX protein
MQEATRSAGRPQAVDNTDWLKIIAIIAVSVGHIGYFFIEDDRWWSVIGRLAAPTLFFFMGYAQSRTVPLHWIWLGFILTLLDSWNADWTWVATNILFSFALIRIARPYVQFLLQHYGWAAFALLVSALFAVLPIASPIVDYGAEGWLWALFGLYHRVYVDGGSTTDVSGTAQSSALLPNAFAKNVALMRLLACVIAAVVYVWQEQKEFTFSQIQLAAVILGIGFLSACLCLFRRGSSRIQPPEAIAGALRFIGRHTLEIYAIQLASSELVKKLLPDLVP